MPTLVERRKLKRQMMACQTPVYNIYYTESVPIPQLPELTNNIARSLPQLSLPNPLAPRMRRSPRGNGFFRRTRNPLRDKKPFFPEEENRRRLQRYTLSQIDDFPKLRVNDQQGFPPGCQSSNVVYQNPFDYQIMNYPSTYITQNQGTVPDADGESQKNYSLLPNATQGSVRASNQLITLPTQPMSSSQGYSMKIQVLAQPLKTEEVEKSTNVKPEEYQNFSNGTIVDFLKEGSATVRSTPRVENGSSLNAVIAEEISTPVQTPLKKKRTSLLSKITKKIMKKRAQPVVSITRSDQVVSNLQTPISKPLEFAIANDQSSGASSRIGQRFSGSIISSEKAVPLGTIREGNATPSSSRTDEDKGSSAYSAQEILSPRKLISSVTNVCSLKKELGNEASKFCENLESPKRDIPNDRESRSISTRPQIPISFQDAVRKLEDTLLRCKVDSAAERELLGSMLLSRLNNCSSKALCKRHAKQLLSKECVKPARGKSTRILAMRYRPRIGNLTDGIICWPTCEITTQQCFISTDEEIKPKNWSVVDNGTKKDIFQG
ncbi:uncharacterized protein LOC105696256 isoform X2 [Orussus abietinus]|uniref:uncharacterized protein LOC105696256 isoform X2 n=1 Tax=Orussus abietinus TaxID=222816 RepID=UPI0006266293|nr:uncharacterized protein LOC105696256 isoform X2 [Orussus abietinus]